MDWHVRRIRASEGEQLKEIRLRALAESPWAFASTLDAEVTRSADLWEAAAETRAGGTEAATFVADRDGTWIGVVGGFRAPSQQAVVELVSMWVAPGHRGLGVGRQLVGAVLGWARDTGAGAVQLWVTRGNDAAIGLYGRAGFVLTEDHQPLPSDPCREELRMVSDLGRTAHA